MKKQEIDDLINKKIGEVLLPLGFNLSKSPGDFFKRFDWGFHCLSIGYIDKLPSHILVGASVGVRLNIVENILQYLVERSKDSYEGSITCGTSLILLSDNKVHLRVSNFSELESTLQYICKIIYKIGLIFLEKYSNLHEAKLFFRDPKMDYSVFPVYYNLIFAKLASDSNFEEIVKYYLPIADNFDVALYRTKFHEIVKYLRENDLEEFKKAAMPSSIFKTNSPTDNA